MPEAWKRQRLLATLRVDIGGNYKGNDVPALACALMYTNVISSHRRNPVVYPASSSRVSPLLNGDHLFCMLKVLFSDFLDYLNHTVTYRNPDIAFFNTSARPNEVTDLPSCRSNPLFGAACINTPFFAKLQDLQAKLHSIDQQNLQ